MDEESDDDFEQKTPGRRGWFAPKRFGIGYRPASWQGFAVLAVVVLLVLLIARFAAGAAAAILPAILLVALMAFTRMNRRP